MTRSERMKPVQQVADSREEQAARELGECQRLVDERQRRLADLESYREEYLRHFHELGSSGASAQRLVELQRFLASLGVAIAQQQRMVEAAQQQCEQLRLHWQQARSKSMAVEKVITRLAEDERVVRDRKEQKQSDEHAANRALARQRSESEHE